jgi:hypothetical protein
VSSIKRKSGENRYTALLENIFFDSYRKGDSEVRFKRQRLEAAAKTLKIELPKNLGDVVYSFRYRVAMPSKILQTQPDGMEWIVEGLGRAEYAFRLVRVNRIVPNPDLVTIKIPDSTPEIVAKYALSDEQALLAKIRYNRLVDIFLGITSYSLQNHLRTTVQGIGQIEIDEIYVGIDRCGRQFVMPVQAKGGNDKLSVVQMKQDIACCREKYPTLICRAISTQFMGDDLIAMFELTQEDGETKVVDEKHYRLVPAESITPQELRQYSNRVA